MGLLKHFKSRIKLKDSADETYNKQYNASNGHQNGKVYYPGSYAVSGHDYTTRLPPQVVTKILEFVCPHALDKSYEACEDADIGDDTCPLCDMRDLSNCAKTRRAWYRPATELLYVHSMHGMK